MQEVKYDLFLFF